MRVRVCKAIPHIRPANSAIIVIATCYFTVPSGRSCNDSPALRAFPDITVLGMITNPSPLFSFARLFRIIVHPIHLPSGIRKAALIAQSGLVIRVYRPFQIFRLSNQRSAVVSPSTKIKRHLNPIVLVVVIEKKQTCLTAIYSPALWESFIQIVDSSFLYASRSRVPHLSCRKSALRVKSDLP